MSTTEKRQTYRVALVGAGYVSSYHLRALRTLPNVDVVGIADPDQTHARQMAAAFGVPRIFQSLEELAETSPDVIHILTPPASHCDLTLQALDMGCHVLVEKPMAITAEECARMMAKAAAQQRILSVNHSARFDPPVLRAFELIRQGAIGEVLTMDYVRSSEYPPYPGGALPAHYRDPAYPFRDLGVHALYLLEAFLGKIENLQVWHQSTGRHPHLLFDEWRAQVACEKGLGQVHLSWNSRPMQNTILVQGTRGALAIDSFLEICTLRRTLPGPKTASLLWNAIFGSVAHAVKAFWNAALYATGRLAPSPDIQRSVREFYLALASGNPPPVRAEEGRRVVAWVEQVAQQALAESRLREAARPAPKSARILVTGGTGFLGRGLVKRLLASGESVRLIVRREPPAAFRDHSRVDVVYGDLGDPATVERAIQGVDVIYHAGAAMSGCWEDFQAGTICGTRNIVQATLRHDVKKFVYVSSLSVLDYVNLSNGAHVDESAALEPFPENRGFYAHGKLEAEKIVLEGVRNGLQAVILRPGQIFGPGAEHVPPYGVVTVGSRWVVMGNGKTALPLVFVDDVVDAMVEAALHNDAVGHILQLVDAETIDQRDYIDICRQAQPGLKVTYAPLPVLYCCAAGLQMLGRLFGRRVPLTIYRLRSIKSLVFDAAAAREKLGWMPRVGVEEGMRQTFGRAAVPLIESTESGVS